MKTASKAVKLIRRSAWIPRELWTRLGLLHHRPRYNGKIICVGFNKTGTTSLGVALSQLGYRHSTFNKLVWYCYYEASKSYARKDIAGIIAYAAKFDSLDDLPWLKEDMIPIMDRVFPKSRFIYLTRDEESWKRSIYHWTYKTFGHYPDLEEDLEKYRKHGAFVMTYFKDRSKDEFIVLDIADPTGFRKLARFLGKTAPQDAFPHANKTFSD